MASSLDTDKLLPCPVHHPRLPIHPYLSTPVHICPHACHFPSSAKSDLNSCRTRLTRFCTFLGLTLNCVLRIFGFECTEYSNKRETETKRQQRQYVVSCCLCALLFPCAVLFFSCRRERKRSFLMSGAIGEKTDTHTHRESERERDTIVMYCVWYLEI